MAADWKALVSKLITLTAAGKLTWEGPEEGAVKDTGRNFSQFFAHYKDKYFRIRKHSGDFVRTSLTGASVKSAAEDKFFLTILDNNKRTLFSLPDLDDYEELYQAVIFQKAGIDKLIHDLLGEET